MATHGRGLVCLPMDHTHAKRLNLPLMVSSNQSRYETNFTVSIEAAKGVTTGISAADRAATVAAAANPNAKPSDIVQPGHIFPIVAKAGGVLTRAGHTEAVSDLARLAGFPPVGVLVEILNEDGTMARRDDLAKVATKHNLKIGTIADLIEYRIATESTIECVSEQIIQTEQGEFALKAMVDTVDNQMHFVLQKGDITKNDTLVRVHVEDRLADQLHITGIQKSWPLPDAMQYINDAGAGVIVLLSYPENKTSLLERISHFPKHKPFDAPIKSLGTGARILKSMGVQKMRVLSPPKKFTALSGFGLEVTEYIKDKHS
jgi:3,4-dihydroxy 2-butanone 4-phosphate synthase/GTP cyclohydrolase II